MLYREIVAIYFQIHTKHINTAVWAERSFPNGEVNISHENTTVVVWIYDGI